MMNNLDTSLRKKLTELLDSQIVLLDGAMGTMIQAYDLQEKDYVVERFADGSIDVKWNNDILSITQPKIIEDIHKEVLEGGANIIETNAFNSNGPSMADYDMANLGHELNFSAAEIARKSVDSFKEKNSREVFVAGVLGPTNRTCSLSPDVEDPSFRNINFDQLVETPYIFTKFKSH